MAGCTLALLLGGCATPGTDGEQRALKEASELAMTRMLDGVRMSEAGWPDTQWWRALGDPQLDHWIERAVSGSPTIAMAQARLDAARAAVLLAQSELRPSAIAALDMTYQRYSESGMVQGTFAGAWRWQNRLAMDVSWDLDLWGRNQAQLQAALGLARAGEIDVFAARLALTGSIARAYIELYRLYELADVGRAAITHREAVLALTSKRFEAGIDSALELNQAQAALPSARAELAAIEESIALTKNLLAALAGAGPDAGIDISRPRPATADSWALPSTLPADLLGRRPDIVAQRWRVEAAARGIDVGRAQFYPNVNLLGFIGLSSIGLSQFISSGALIAGIGPAVRLPLFDGGVLRGDLAQRRAQYDLAVSQYNQTLIDAIREVADQVSSWRALQARRAQQAAALDGYRKAYELTMLRYREGLGNFLQVLDAEVQLLRENRIAADLRARSLDLAVQLARALGGGFE
jgi:NodT family efflux transporter outer membrane factor (OMF) lipoprotein